MSPPVRVRAARTEDAQAVAALFNALNTMDSPPPPVAMTEDAVRRDLLGAAPGAASPGLSARFSSGKRASIAALRRRSASYSASVISGASFW